jgi:hypothetical protein
MRDICEFEIRGRGGGTSKFELDNYGTLMVTPSEYFLLTIFSYKSLFKTHSFHLQVSLKIR